jgi:hypothetical protein
VPEKLHIVPLEQVPQLPPHPSPPHCFPAQFPVHGGSDVVLPQPNMDVSTEAARNQRFIPPTPSGTPKLNGLREAEQVASGANDF